MQTWTTIILSYLCPPQLSALECGVSLAATNFYEEGQTQKQRNSAGGTYGDMLAFHPILVSSLLVAFGNEATKISHNSSFVFHYVLPILPWKQKTSWNLSDKNQKRNYQNMWWAVQWEVVTSIFWEVICLFKVCF